MNAIIVCFLRTYVKYESYEWKNGLQGNLSCGVFLNDFENSEVVVHSTKVYAK